MHSSREAITEGLLDEQDYRGFPIVNNTEDRILLGYIGRVELLAALSASTPSSALALLDLRS